MKQNEVTCPVLLLLYSQHMQVAAVKAVKQHTKRYYCCTSYVEVVFEFVFGDGSVLFPHHAPASSG